MSEQGILELLKNLSFDNQIRLVSRALLRTLPVVAKHPAYSEPFGYWEKGSRVELLQFLFRAMVVAVYAKKAANSRLIRDIISAVGELDGAPAAVMKATAFIIAAIIDAKSIGSSMKNDQSVAAVSSIGEAFTMLVSVRELDERGHWEKCFINDIAIVDEEEDLFVVPLFNVDEENVYWVELVDFFLKNLIIVDPSFEFWAGWYNDRVQGIPLDNDLLNIIINPPSEIVAQGFAAVNAYLFGVRNKTASLPLNRVRAIFIGHGEAGKTSLVKALHGENVAAGGTDMTPGVDIRHWEVPNTDIVAHFWDFGGQVMVHATHKFFLRSKCVYILVLNARKEIEATEQAEYWLEHVKVFGGSAPVLIVANRADETPLFLNMAALEKKYRNVKGYYPVSCTQAKGAFKPQMDTFKMAFCEEIRALGTHQIKMTKYQFNVMKRLNDLSAKRSFLSKEEFDCLCDNNKISKHGIQNRRWLLDLLDKLGVVVHFAEVPFVNGYVLNPRWLTYGVYTLMYAGKPRLFPDDVIRILSKKPKDERGSELAYPRDRCHLIVQAMKQFKLCYEIPGSHGCILIPALLSPEEPLHRFAEAKAMEFEYVFETFLPRNVISELIVAKHDQVIEQFVWQTGALFEHRTWDARALLRADYQYRTVHFTISGRNSREYLTLWRDEMEKVLARLNIEAEEFIILPVSDAINSTKQKGNDFEKISYRQLIFSEIAGIEKISSKKGNLYLVREALGQFVEHERLIKDSNNITININDCTVGNVVAARKVERSLNDEEGGKKE